MILSVWQKYEIIPGNPFKMTEIKADSQQHPGKLFDLALFLVTGLYSWPVIFRLPYTLKILFEAFRPGGFHIADKDLWAFSSMDARVRPWYNKIARDYHTQGRFGFVWDDGLGMPLGVRIYNNWATYALLNALGTRRMMGIGFLLMLGATSALCGWRFGIWSTLPISLLVAGSPLLVASYTHRGKPEVFWWGPALIFICLAISETGWLTGLAWSCLAWVNLPVSIMLSVMLAPAMLFRSLATHSLPGLILGVLPGLLKHAIRGLHMWRSGFLGSLTSEQSRLVRLAWYPSRRELLWWFPFLLSIFASTYTSRQFVLGGLIAVMGIGLCWVNLRFIYLNDPSSFLLALWTIGFGYAVVMHSYIGVWAILLLAYSNLLLCGIPGSHGAETAQSWRQKRRDVWSQIGIYPALKPMAFPQPSSVMDLFNQIPDGARLLTESDGDPRTQSKFRAFWVWTEEFLPYRQIDLVNEMYTRAVEFDLTDNKLARFNAQQMSGEEMKQLCETLGVSYVVAYTSDMVTALEQVGYQTVSRENLQLLGSFLEIVAAPPSTLTLLKSPVSATIIDPPVSWTRNKNALSWIAKGNQPYIIRYRYHQDFQAFQNEKPLPITPTRPFSGIKVTFMSVTAPEDGMITLSFHSRFI